MAGGGVVALMIDPALSRGSSEVLLIAGVAALFLLAAATASWLPARRASRVDPVAALRDW
jgi:ABC-type antimicrobial peptide transport system permease subunit